MTITLKFSLLTFMTGLLLPMAELHAGTASQDVKFLATVYGGGCDISVPPNFKFNNGDPVMRDSVAAGNESLEIPLTISKCDGYFMKPKIMVSGTSSSMQGTQLFADASSSAKGYGILLSTAGNSGWSENTNLAESGVVDAKNWPSGGTNSVIGLNGNLTFNAKLSCGACASNANLNGGILTSTVTFTFAYN